MASWKTKTRNEALISFLGEILGGEGNGAAVDERLAEKVEFCNLTGLAALSPHWPQDAKMARRHRIYQISVLTALDPVLREAEKRHIPVAVLKGPVLQNVYPRGSVRLFSDVDLYVPWRHQGAFDAMMAELTFHKCGDIMTGQQEVSLYALPNGMEIEVHALLCVQLPQKTRDRLDGEGCFREDRFISTDVGGYAIPTLEHTEHLYYLIYHFAKHLPLREKGNLRSLVDIALFTDAYADAIDMQKLRRLLDASDLSRVAGAVFGFCARRLGMKTDTGIPCREAWIRRLEEDLVCCPQDVDPYAKLFAQLYGAVCYVDEGGELKCETRFRPRQIAHYWNRRMVIPVIRWLRTRRYWRIRTEYPRLFGRLKIPADGARGN